MYVFDWFVVRDSIAGNAGRVEVGMDIDAQVGFKIEASRPDELRDLENRFAPYTYWSQDEIVTSNETKRGVGKSLKQL